VDPLSSPVDSEYHADLECHADNADNAAANQWSTRAVRGYQIDVGAMEKRFNALENAWDFMRRYIGQNVDFRLLMDMGIPSQLTTDGIHRFISSIRGRSRAMRGLIYSIIPIFFQSEGSSVLRATVSPMALLINMLWLFLMHFHPML